MRDRIGLNTIGEAMTNRLGAKWIVSTVAIAGLTAAILSSACGTSPDWLTVTAETKDADKTATASIRSATWHAENEERKRTTPKPYQEERPNPTSRPANTMPTQTQINNWIQDANRYTNWITTYTNDIARCASSDVIDIDYVISGMERLSENMSSTGTDMMDGSLDRYSPSQVDAAYDDASAFLTKVARTCDLPTP